MRIPLFFLIGLSLICLELIIAPVAQAESSSFSLAPAVLKIHAEQPASISEPFTISNRSDTIVHLQIETRFFHDSGGEDGSILYLNQNDIKEMKNYQDFSKKIHVLDGEKSVTDVTLGPKQKKNLLLQITIPKDEPNEDYDFSLIFSTDKNARIDNKGKTTVITVQSAIALNILLAIGKANPQAYLDTFSTSFYIESGPVPFLVRVVNPGSQFVTPKGAIIITNMFGQIIGRVDLAPASLLSGSVRTIPDFSQYMAAAQTPNTFPGSAVWSEKFLFGFYTANLSLQLIPGNQVFIKSIHFISFPSRFLVELFIAIIILVIIIVRVKKKISGR